MTPTQRSLAWLRKRGWIVGIVEKWNHVVHIRQDLWHFADLISSKLGEQATLIQVCSAAGGDVAARRRKIQENKYAQLWLQAGHAVEIHGWAKRGARGETKKWTLRRLQAVWNPADNVNPVAFVEES